ncbi:response regulator [Desulfovibrio inopinatus]|uniref:response regulator n=1 Tax=Desulfovibrio inopinatus TaxID=102109 RepID=UPI0003F93A9D|nr:response regulator [Desulfovibrio inopinatus]
MNHKLRLRNIRIQPKITFFFLLIGLIPLTLVGLYGGELAMRAMKKESIARLVSIQETRKKEVENAFKERIKNIQGLAQSQRIDSLCAALRLYMTRSSTQGAAAFEQESEAFQGILGKYVKALNVTSQTYDFHSIYLVTPQTGDVQFVTSDRPSLGANLAHGPLKNSGLAKAWRDVIETKTSSLVDFEPFGRDQAQIAFIGEPVFGDLESLKAVLIVSITPDFINSIMSSNQGLGQTGESYLIRWFRNSHTFAFRSDITQGARHTHTVGTSISPLPYWIDAANGQKPKELYTDSQGQLVIVAYEKITFGDLNWFLVSKINQSEIIAPIQNIVNQTLLFSAVLALCIILFAYFFAKNFIRPIRAGVAFAEAISEGRLNETLELNQKDELGDLARALNHMAANLFENDWLRRGKEELDNSMRGEHGLQDLSRRFIAVLSRHLEAQLGAIYIHDDGILLLTAGFSYANRHDGSHRYKIGEGFIGQAAQERTMLIYNTAPKDAPVLDYGSGEETPNHFLAMPMVYDDKLIGVFMLGKHRAFTALQKRFIERNIEAIAILFNIAQSRRTIKSLLKRSEDQQDELLRSNMELERQAQALKESEAELQAQQEELRVTNEELEEQTRALKESQSSLQAQQEELRVTNEELEQRTQALEQQKEAIRNKNAALVKAKSDLNQKAKDLTAASKYKSEFLANMSHELRTPLNSILILSQLFSNNKEGNLTDKQMESAKAIHSSGADLLALINEILDLSKVESGKVELVIENTPLTTIIHDLQRVFRDVAQDKGIDFNISLAPDLPETISTDTLRIQQVLRNLLNNAFKFTSEGSVSLKIFPPSKELLEKIDLEGDDLIAFEVKDQGIGIPKSHQAAIFEAFQQVDGSTRRKYGGTGLGLSISRELVKLLGGTIHLESEEGVGSSFTVILPHRSLISLDESPSIKRDVSARPTTDENNPLKTDGPVCRVEPTLDTTSPDDAGAPQDEEREHSELVKDDRKNITDQDRVLLVIEDDSTFAQVMRDFARERGFKCVVAEDGETGLHFADYFKPSAIILDIGLPGIDGWTVMERLKDNPSLRHIPVHFMSASDSSMDAMRMGAVGFLTKPVSMEKIQEAFSKIERIITKPVRKLLVIEDDPIQRDSIKQLIGNGDVETTTVSSGQEALQELNDHRYDCIVLDLGLDDMSGFELLDKIQQCENCTNIPVIVYTGRELSVDQDTELRKYAESIIVKGVKSPERLLDETALFLHRVESNLPREKQRPVKMNHDKDAMFKDKTILVVDDDMRNVFALSNALEEKDLNVIVARNGQESIDKLKDHPEINLVLMDIMMPVMDGYEAMRAIRKNPQHKKLPIIALTAKAMKGDRNLCIEAGANDYLAKPVDTEKLLSMLRVWLYE